MQARITIALEIVRKRGASTKVPQSSRDLCAVLDSSVFRLFSGTFAVLPSRRPVGELMERPDSFGPKKNIV